MLEQLKVFESNIKDAKSLNAIYNYLNSSVRSPFNFDDLLRWQVVYSLSAFDKLMHDIIRIGMVSIYVGARPATEKYRSEGISIQVHGQLVSASFPPKEAIFEAEVARKLKIQTFQDPDKVADGLSYIWAEKHKWQKIAREMGVDADWARTRLKLITGRRNSIVHEADTDPLTHQRNMIEVQECDEISDFIADCGRAIVRLVS